MDRYKRLGDILLAKKWITPAQLEKALSIQQRTHARLGKILVESGFISEDRLLQVLSERFGVEMVKIDSYAIDANVVRIIPLEMARRHKIIPLFVLGDVITLAMADPLDINAIDAVRYHTGKQVQEVVASEKDIELAINRFYSMSESMDRVLSSLERQAALRLSENDKNAELELQADSDETSIIRFVNLLLVQAIREKASDVHLEPGENFFRIRFRVDGMLREITSPPRSLTNMIVARIKVLSNLDVSEKRLPQDGRFRIKLESREVDVRVSILPTVHGEKAVLRLLDPETAILSLESLGFSEHVLERWRQVIKKTEGIILITGPTGSGKSSTLYAVLNEINSIEKNIITVENPVEFKIPNINQVQVNTEIGMTFAAALRSILRQDPDVIMIGEIRDTETAEIAIRAALTGHLVYSTLHTNDAPSAIARLTDMDIEPFLVATSVNAVLAQRLARKICQHCKTEDPGRLSVLARHLGSRLPSDVMTYKGKGCRECNNSGFSGRTGIYELLVLDDHLKQTITDGGSEHDIRRYAQEHGMETLKRDGIRKVLEGITTIDEVLRVCSR